MIETVFISDLHLHPERADIQERFDAFVRWAKSSVKNIYILGDFFHAWAGDDSINDWSRGIAAQLRDLAASGICLFYMSGNRDFLLGSEFAQQAGWTVLHEPCVITLGEQHVLLVHGDRYCTKDKAHQRFRALTRNCLFSWFFLKLPLSYRERLVNKVRQMSEGAIVKTMEQMDVVPDAVKKHMLHYKVKLLIHGHTHKPGVTSYAVDGQELARYVLSDWDDRPTVLCYYYSMGIFLNQMDFLGRWNG